MVLDRLKKTKTLERKLDRNAEANTREIYLELANAYDHLANLLAPLSDDGRPVGEVLRDCGLSAEEVAEACQ